jgi:hypothetical protein
MGDKHLSPVARRPLAWQRAGKGVDTLFDIKNPKKLIGLFCLQPLRFNSDS